MGETNRKTVTLRKAYGDLLKSGLALQRNSLEWAENQIHLGRNQMDQAYSALGMKEIEKALIHLKNAELFFRKSKSEYPTQWGQLQGLFGNAYREFRNDDWPANIEIAIRRYMEALKYLEGDKRAIVLNNFGIAYLRRIKYTRNENIKKAIRCFKEALKIHTFEFSKLDWLYLQNSLATAYRNLQDRNYHLNIEKSISIYTECLNRITPTEFPSSWAMIAANLADAYTSRIVGSSSENLQKAINLSFLALFERKKLNLRKPYLEILNNLGLYFSDLEIGNLKRNQEIAIKCLKEVLKNLRGTKSNYFKSTVLNNLGKIYIERKSGSRLANIHKAINYYRRVLELQSVEANPGIHAKTLSNLGSAYRKLIIINSAYFDKALRCYQKALELRKPEKQPVLWSKTLFNLAVSMRENPYGNRQDNLKRAARYVEKIILVRKLEKYPVDYRKLTAFLARVYLLQADFQTAFHWYSEAFKADQYIYERSVLFEEQLKNSAEFSEIYFNGSWCLSRMGKHEEALEWLEIGKMRYLSGISALNKMKLDYLSRKQQAGYRELAESLKFLHFSQRERDVVDLKTTEEIHHLDEKFRKLIQQIRRKHPDFCKSNFKFQDLVSVGLPRDTGIIVFNITEFGTILSFIRWDNGTVYVEATQLDELTLQHTQRIWEKWRRRYDRLAKLKSSEEKERWGKNANYFMREISAHFNQPVFDWCQKHGLKNLVVVPHRTLYTLPLQLIQIKQHKRWRYFSDFLNISFVPSLKLINFSHPGVSGGSSSTASDPMTLTAISNPTGDLKFADYEVDQIVRIFPGQVRVLKQDQAEIKAVLHSIRQSTFIHFACHAEFNENNPLKSCLILANGDKEEMNEDFQGIPTVSEGMFPEYSKLAQSDLPGYLIDYVKNSLETVGPSGVEKEVGSDPLRMDAHSRVFRSRRKPQLLTLNRIFAKMSLRNNHLVVLSACETGIIESRENANEFIGLPAGFLIAGAKNVVAGSWKVDDKATSRLMELFYMYYFQRKESMVSALMRAQKKLRSEKCFANPYYWSAFYFTGVAAVSGKEGAIIKTPRYLPERNNCAIPEERV